jgi:hypothetical protein
MNLIHTLAVGAVVSMLFTPVQAQEETSFDPALDCGAFFLIMAQQADSPDDANAFTSMSDLLLNDLDGRLAYMGVSLEERERIGGDAVTRVAQRVESGNIGIAFADCHAAMERAIEAAMPGKLSGTARDLLICGSQFSFTLQSGEADEATNANLKVASDDQLRRAGVSLGEGGMTAEEQDRVSLLYGLSIGMVLGMGEDPIIAWEKCGEV